MSVSQFSGAGSGRPPRTQPVPLPPLARLATAALRVSGLVLDGPRSVPTQAKRDVTGLPIDARTFLADARALHEVLASFSPTALGPAHPASDVAGEGRGDDGGGGGGRLDERESSST